MSGQPFAVGARAVAGARHGAGDDRAEIIVCNDGLILLIVDGAGGTGGASDAADAVVEAVRERSGEGASTIRPTEILASIDRGLLETAGGGQAAVVDGTAPATRGRGS